MLGWGQDITWIGVDIGCGVGVVWVDCGRVWWNGCGGFGCGGWIVEGSGGMGGADVSWKGVVDAGWCGCGGVGV